MRYQEIIHNQCINENPKERIKALKQLKYNFLSLSDKELAWNDLIRLTNDKYWSVRREATSALRSAFAHMPDKQLAWNDLHRLTSDEDSSVRREATSALGSALSEVPDKQQAWNDLHRLTSDEDSDVRREATLALGSAFSEVPDKQLVWNDLVRLTYDKDYSVRFRASSILGSTFSKLPDKQQAWNDLHRLVSDKDRDVRYRTAYILGSAFSQVPDKQLAWNDLHRLTFDEDIYVRREATSALGSAFAHVPDKQLAWSDLHRLTSNKNSYVRRGAALALGSAFAHVPDKQLAWNDLHRLTSDEDSDVRIYANHSFGKVSIFQASQAEKEENYKEELEAAISFFEKAARERSKLVWNNPAKFCLPFYRSFYTITFKKQEAIEEVNKYLKEAKSAIKGSDSKKQLFEAVQNLAEALKEVQNLENLDLQAMKGELNFYRKYCDRAAELMNDTNENAPYATEVLRKGLPLLDRNLKKLIEEIKEKAKIACQVSQGTPTQEIACTVSEKVQRWEIGSQEEMSRNIENLIFTLESNIPRAPENQFIFNRIQQVREEKDLANQYGIVCTIIPLIPRLSIERGICKIEKVVDEVNEKVNTIIIKLDEIQKELTKGFEKLDILSSEIGGKEGELIKNFSKRIHELIEKRDKETLENFLEEVRKKENVLTEEIEKSSVPLEEKEESKRSIVNVKSVLDKVKYPIKSFGKDVTNEIIVNYTAKETVKLVFQLVSMAALGFPIPSPILNLLSSIVENP